MYVNVNVCAGAAIHMHVCGPTQVSFHRGLPPFYWVRSGHWSRTKWARLWPVNLQNNTCTLFPPHCCWGYKPVSPFLPLYVDSGPQIQVLWLVRQRQVMNCVTSPASILWRVCNFSCMKQCFMVWEFCLVVKHLGFWSVVNFILLNYEHTRPVIWEEAVHSPRWALARSF